MFEFKTSWTTPGSGVESDGRSWSWPLACDLSFSHAQLYSPSQEA